MFEDHIVEIYTICMGRWRVAEKAGVELKDVTFKSKDMDLKRLFAPPNFNLVMDYKTGKISECEYKEAYLNKLKRSSTIYFNEWIDFLTEHNSIALACYCGKEDHCHRKLLADFLFEFGEENDIDVKLMGELREDVE